MRYKHIQCPATDSYSRLAHHAALPTLNTALPAVLHSLRPLPLHPRPAQILLRETLAAQALEMRLGIPIDCGGLRSREAEQALGRAERGGSLTPEALNDICVGLLTARRLRQAITGAAKQDRVGEDLSPLVSLVEELT